MKLFKLDSNFGPPKLRKIHKLFVDAINSRTPKEGFGIKLRENEDGCQISVASETQKQQDSAETTDSGGGSSGGTASDIYGSLNGQPAVFHLSQTANPQLVSP